MLELIERKAQGEEIAVQPEAPQPAQVPDLMAALEASLAAVKDRDATATATAATTPRRRTTASAKSKAKARSKPKPKAKAKS